MQSQFEILSLMGVDVYRSRDASSADSADERQRIDCDSKLAAPVKIDRTQAASSTYRVRLAGDSSSPIFFVAQAFDWQGRKPTAVLFQRILASINLPLDQVGLLLLESDEQAYDSPSSTTEQPVDTRSALIQQINKYQPKLLVALGELAIEHLLGDLPSIDRLRGQIHQVAEGKIPTLISYHPQHLLDVPIDKAKVWQDLLLLNSMR